MKKTLVLMGLGAGFMYLLDPEQGERRRAQLREQLAGVLPKTSGAIQSKADNLTTKVDSLAAETISTVGPGSDSDGSSSDV
jgi:hypothetical protein